MIRRLLGTIALSTLTLALGCSRETPPSVMPETVTTPGDDGKPLSTKAQVQKALEVGKDNPEKAIAILEKALKSDPDDREALLLLSVVSVVQGESTKETPARIALFHQAFATFARIKKNQQELNAPEKSFEPRIAFGEVRALALEGKTAEAFTILKGLMASGSEDFDSIDTVEDLRPVVALPEFRTYVDSLYAPRLAEATKEVASELGSTRSFPFDFQLKDLDDKKVSLAEYKGKVTIVDVWGTWCPPCRKEIPHFVALLEKYKAKGFDIVGINCNEEGTEAEVKKTIRDFAKAYKIDYKCVINDDTIQTKIPDFQAYPTTLFLDRTGKVRLMFVGQTSKAKLEAAIITLLSETPKAP